MQTYFKIYQSSVDDDRPPISFKVREYFEQFIIEKVFVKKGVVVGGEWQLILSIFFSKRGPRTLFSRMALAQSATVIKAERQKVYELVILTDEIQSSNDPFLKTIDLMYEGISLFLTSVFKKVTAEFLAELRQLLDMDYLLSLPYPAPFEEQKYLLDDQLFTRNADGTVVPTSLQEQAKRTDYKGGIPNDDNAIN